jgi:hypothetical protein
MMLTNPAPADFESTSDDVAERGATGHLLGFIGGASGTQSHTDLGEVAGTCPTQNSGPLGVVNWER